MSALLEGGTRKKFDCSDDARSYEEHQRKKRMAYRESEARKYRHELKRPVTLLRGEDAIPRKEKQAREMQRIDKKYH
jgi:hypothetical protein